MDRAAPKAHSAAMVSLAHLKRRLGQYAAVWVAGFLLAGTAILAGLWFADLMSVADLVLPAGLLLVALAMVFIETSDTADQSKCFLVVMPRLPGRGLLTARRRRSITGFMLNCSR